jgi:hypothetical protein
LNATRATNATTKPVQNMFTSHHADTMERSVEGGCDRVCRSVAADLRRIDQSDLVGDRHLAADDGLQFLRAEPRLLILAWVTILGQAVAEPAC